MILNIKKAVELYTGRKVAVIVYQKDPKVEGTYAIQTHLSATRTKGRKKGKPKTVCEWLLCRVNSDMTPQELCDRLEEVEFNSWPPVSGSLQFFL